MILERVGLPLSCKCSRKRPCRLLHHFQVLYIVVLTLKKQGTRVTFCKDAPCAPHVRTLIPLRRGAQSTQHHLWATILAGIDDRGVVIAGKSRIAKVDQLDTRVAGPPVRKVPVRRRLHTREAIKIKTVSGKQHILRLQIGVCQPHLPTKIQTQQHLPGHHLQIRHPEATERIRLQTIVKGDPQGFESQTIPATTVGEIFQHTNTPRSAVSVSPRDFAQDGRLYTR
mmetsp:Transcript_3891/g.8657  ORF Transcript_3891/g.8657 Transcript_3891/m.8657 type:complete len:226 (-) Transcript_3891:596-1273(-)